MQLLASHPNHPHPFCLFCFLSPYVLRPLPLSMSLVFLSFAVPFCVLCTRAAMESCSHNNVAWHGSLTARLPQTQKNGGLQRSSAGNRCTYHAGCSGNR